MRNKILFSIIAIAFVGGMFTVAYAGPVLTEITLAGNVDITGDTSLQGDMTFSDDTKTITFPATTSPNNPMIEMFSGGTFNDDRTVIAHSPSFPNWGLQYRDDGDDFVFTNGAIDPLTIGMSTGDVEVERDLIVGDDLSVGGTNKLLFGKCTVSIGPLVPNLIAFRECTDPPGADITDEAIVLIQSSTGSPQCLQISYASMSDSSLPIDIAFTLRNECTTNLPAQDVTVAYILFDVP